MPNETRRKMRLLVQDVGDRDVAKIRSSLLDAENRLRFSWDIVATGEAAVVVYGAEEPETVLGMLEEPLRTLCLRELSESDHLRPIGEPLHLERLIDTLLDVEKAVHEQLAAQVGGVDRRARQVESNPAFVLEPSNKYRLRRWPNVDTLSKHKSRVRLACFLSARTVSLEELERLANVDKGTCRDFLSTLFSAGALSIETTPSITAHNETAQKPVARSAATGFFRALRAKLGMAS